MRPRPGQSGDSARGVESVPQKVDTGDRACVGYKDIATLSKLITAQGKMLGRKRSGNCAKHQRQVRIALKRARFIALLPYT